MSTLATSIDRLREIRAAARRWIDKGYRVVPLPRDSKSPKGADFVEWQKRDWKPEDFKADYNIGLQNGPCAAGHLISIDCDCPEVIALAPLFLPSTNMIGGRAARGRAHYHYLGDEAFPARRIQFGSKVDGYKTLIEFRSSEGEADDNGEIRPTKGHQTIVPPSLHHPSGEPYQLYADGDPTKVNARDLRRRVYVTAAGALLARSFPANGRHALALALGATLLRGGWKPEDAHHFILHTFTVAGSRDPKTRADSVHHSAEMLTKGEPTTGTPTLREILGDKIVDKLVEWLDLKLARAAGAAVDGERYLRSHSYLSAVTIVANNTHDILDGRALEWNEMVGCAELGREPLLDTDVTTIRSEIEKRVDAGADKNGNPIGISLSLGDVHHAVLQVAGAASYHPVREYLRSLKWDGKKRLEAVVKILGAVDDALNRAIIKRWFIAAVARPLAPGCKQDHMLVLVGPQGRFKSSAFRALAGETWFCDSPIDVGDKDAYQTLRRAWILEWSEMESLARARDAGAVKAFLTSAVDTYRPSYGRLDVRVQRSGVIVGSTNNVEFLADETGSRRFWPMTIGTIDLAELASERDQLWAESVALYDAGEQWWLTPTEEALLAPIHELHAVSDAWGAPVLEWIEQPRATTFIDGVKIGETVERTTAAVLQHVLKRQIGEWSRADENRIGAVLRRAGWTTYRPDRNGPRVWRKP